MRRLIAWLLQRDPEIQRVINQKGELVAVLFFTDIKHSNEWAEWEEVDSG